MRKVGLETRVLGLFGLLVAALVAVTLFLVHVQVGARVRTEVRERLETSHRIVEELLATRAEELLHKTSLVAELPIVRDAAQDWSADRISRAFREINRLIGAAVIVFTDRMGIVLARSDRLWEPGETLDDAPGVAHALRGRRTSGIWIEDGRLYHMVSLPIRRESGLAGTLSLGFGMRTELARELARLSGTEVALLVRDGDAFEIVAASRELEPTERDAATRLAAELDDPRPRFDEVVLRPDRPALAAAPFFGAESEPVGAYVLLRPLAKDVAEIAALERSLGISALVALVAALAIGFVLSRSITRPLAILSDGATQLAGGHYDFALPRPSGSREVEDLTRAFETMRKALRSRIGELDGLNARLEEMVHDRTVELERALDENRRLLAELRAWSDSLERKVEERTREVADAQQMLVRQDRMAAVGRLAAGVAHEINNPLGILAGFAEALRDRARHPDLLSQEAFADFPEYLRLIQEEVDRLQAIVEKFLSFARSREPRKEPVDLNDVARHVLGLLTGQARRAGKHLDGQLAASPVETEADPEQLKQVLLNLVLNGLDAVGRGGRVLVTTKGGAEHCELDVEDDGPGIPAGLRERIFEPFFSTKPPEEGTGLGLALCADLARENGGSLELREPDGGRGSIFVVRLRSRTGRAETRAHA